MTQSELYSNLYELYGNINRARGNFLYTQKGVRIVDLFRQNGRAILGWGGDSAFTMFKNSLNRGVTGGFVTKEDYRLEKAVSDLFNADCRVAAFTTEEGALAFAKKISSHPEMYRPWESDVCILDEKKVFVVAPSMPWTQSIWLVAVKAESAESADSLAFSDSLALLPPPVKAGLSRSIYNLIAAYQKYSEKDFFLYDKYLNPYFTRKGPWLYSKITDPAEYDRFVRHCLEQGILLPPAADVPAIVPFGADTGIFASLKKNPFVR